jgi:hypothetical protein
LSQVTQIYALNPSNCEKKRTSRVDAAGAQSKNKGSGQPNFMPESPGFFGRHGELAFVGVSFYDVSFRTFTATSTTEKGTPTVQRFDNRSIALLLDACTRCICRAVPIAAVEKCN